jgi:Lrp/AsnC family transcriptional regulator
MTSQIDDIDRKILRILQRNAALSVDEVAEQIALSRNACWRRMRALEDRGVLTAKVALADPQALGCPLQVMVLIRSSSHDPEWLVRFHRVVDSMPEVVGAYRMTGDLDYLLRVRVADVAGYDLFYKKLITRMPLSDISASFVMEEIKETTALPVT